MSFSKVILTTYAYVPLSEVRNTDLPGKLVVRHRYERTRIKMYRIANNKWFGIPIHYDENIYKNTKIYDKRSTGTPINFNFTSNYREGQENVINQFSKNFKAGRTGFILEAQPAAGKTVIAIKMMQIVGLSSIIIVPRENLVWQWKERLLEHSDITEKDIGIVCGRIYDWRGKLIVIALVHTCATGRLTEQCRKSFGCIIFDEVHSSVPPATFSPVLGMFPAKIRIGMSATVKRDDGLDIIFRYHLGQVFLTCKSCERMKAKVIAHYFKESSGSLYSGLGTKQRRGVLVSKLASNTVRNKLIVWYLISFVKSGRRVAVLSDRVEQLILLRDGLVSEMKKYKLSPLKAGFYVGALGKRTLRKEEIDRVASECGVIFATYQKFDLGTDIKDLAGVIYGTPHKNIEQKQGRAERWMKDKKDPVAVDIVDTFYNDTVRWFEHRVRFYRSAGVEIKSVK